MTVLDEHVAHSKSVELQELAEFKMFKLLFFSRNSSVLIFSNGMGKEKQVLKSVVSEFSSCQEKGSCWF